MSSTFGKKYADKWRWRCNKGVIKLLMLFPQSSAFYQIRPLSIIIPSLDSSISSLPQLERNMLTNIGHDGWLPILRFPPSNHQAHPLRPSRFNKTFVVISTVFAFTSTVACYSISQHQHVICSTFQKKKPTKHSGRVRQVLPQKGSKRDLEESSERNSFFV